MRRHLQVKGVAIVATLGATLAVTATASAHNVSQRAAKNEVRAYARAVLSDPEQTPDYTSASTQCEAAQSGHNHIVSCTVLFSTATQKNVCEDQIQAYEQAHNLSRGRLTGPYFRHTATPCGQWMLIGPRQHADDNFRRPPRKLNPARGTVRRDMQQDPFDN